jgi:hypothetical protein
MHGDQGREVEDGGPRLMMQLALQGCPALAEAL